MEHCGEKSRDSRRCGKRFLSVKLLFCFIVMQVSVACGVSSQAHADAQVSCINPTPSNNGISAQPVPATPGVVVINEVLTLPQSQWNCTVSQPSNGSNLQNAWVEIYNPQNQPLDLYAARASIDEGQGTPPFVFRYGSIINAHGFLVVFPFIDAKPISLVRLVISQVVVIDQVSVPSLVADTSYARIPDGSNNWQITTTPTIASSNQSVAAVGQTVQGSSKQKEQPTKGKSTKAHSGGISNDGASADGAGVDGASPGVQPTWSALSLPSSGSNNTVTNNNPSGNSTMPADPFDLLKKILFTLLIAVLFLALRWCWQLYRKRKARTLHLDL